MPEPAEDARVRIGYVSSVFFEHSTVMKIYIGWLRELNPKESLPSLLSCWPEVRLGYR